MLNGCQSEVNAIYIAFVRVLVCSGWFGLKWIAPIAILVWSLTSQVYAWETAETSSILETSKAGLVKIVVSGNWGSNNPKEDFGSGFVVNAEGFVISAAHLFSSQWQDMRIDGRIAYLNNDDVDGRRNLTELNLVSKNEATDVALLKFVEKPEGMRPLPVRLELPTQSDKLFILGFPGGQNLSTKYPIEFVGLVNPHKFQFQGVANLGNSGGPILDENGFVVGIDQSAEIEKNQVPINNTYLAVPAKDFLFPKDFDSTKVRPLFQNPGLDIGVQNGTGWNLNSINEALNDFAQGEKSPFCNVPVKSTWNVRKNPTKGFLIAPPFGSELLKSEFQFEFLVRQKEKYLVEQQRREDSGDFGRSPFGVIPVSNQTILLSKIMIDQSLDEQSKIVPFIFQNIGKRKIIFQYFPRFFGRLDFKPKDADLALILCGQNGTLPDKVYFPLCESLVKQALRGYFDQDNPCLPGKSKLQ